VSNDGQKHALTLAKSYAHNFGSGFASFVFSGGCGTGKIIWLPPSVTTCCSKPHIWW
jgi:DNA replication protein DnaC